MININDLLTKKEEEVKKIKTELENLQNKPLKYELGYKKIYDYIDFIAFLFPKRDKINAYTKIKKFETEFKEILLWKKGLNFVLNCVYLYSIKVLKATDEGDKRLAKMYNDIQSLHMFVSHVSQFFKNIDDQTILYLNYFNTEMERIINLGVSLRTFSDNIVFTESNVYKMIAENFKQKKIKSLLDLNYDLDCFNEMSEIKETFNEQNVYVNIVEDLIVDNMNDCFKLCCFLSKINGYYNNDNYLPILSSVIMAIFEDENNYRKIKMIFSAKTSLNTKAVLSLPQETIDKVKKYCLENFDELHLKIFTLISFSGVNEELRSFDGSLEYNETDRIIYKNKIEKIISESDFYKDKEKKYEANVCEFLEETKVDDILFSDLNFFLETAKKN